MQAVRIVPLLGEVYTHQSGGEYQCVERREKGPGDLWPKAKLRRLSDSWTFWAHDIRQNEDGTIFWSFSTGGIFVKDPMGVEAEAAELAALRTERDAAVAESEKLMKRFSGPEVCELCGMDQKFCEKHIAACWPKWRGPRKETP